MIVVMRDLLDVLFATLWQGATIAAVTAALLWFGGSRMNAATRAVILQITLFAIVAVPLSTTFLSMHAQSAQIGGYGVEHRAAAFGDVSSRNSIVTSRRIDVALGDRTVLTIAAVWFLGAFSFVVRIIAGELQLRRILRDSRRIDDRDGARMYVSPNARVPFATGFRSAAIVVPASLAQSERAALDSVLLHEIAHVRRRDVWSNACERIVQAALFFNPAAHLVIRAISFEREAACDDWAVATTHDLDGYVRALAMFALRQQTPHSPIGATLGFGHATISRLRRLEDTRRNGATTLSRTVLRGSMFSLVSVALALQLFAPAVAFSPVSNAVHVAAVTASCDTPSAYVDGPEPRNLPQGDYDAQVLVNVSATGAVTGVSVKKSSGNATFDNDVVVIAVKSRFTPQRRNCVLVAGSYVFKVHQTKQ